MAAKRTILLGVTGSIAAYKSADMTSKLTKLGHEVFCVMTKPRSRNRLPLVGTHTSASDEMSSAENGTNTSGVRASPNAPAEPSVTIWTEVSAEPSTAPVGA